MTPADQAAAFLREKMRRCLQESIEEAIDDGDRAPTEAEMARAESLMTAFLANSGRDNDTWLTAYWFDGRITFETGLFAGRPGHGRYCLFLEPDERVKAISCDSDTHVESEVLDDEDYLDRAAGWKEGGGDG